LPPWGSSAPHHMHESSSAFDFAFLLGWEIDRNRCVPKATCTRTGQGQGGGGGGVGVGASSDRSQYKNPWRWLGWPAAAESDPRPSAARARQPPRPRRRPCPPGPAVPFTACVAAASFCIKSACPPGVRDKFAPLQISMCVAGYHFTYQ
jgi:hypothetical protein